MSKKITAKNFGRLHRLRQIVQLSALLLFLYLLLGTRQGGTTFLPHDLFFRLDPLVSITMIVHARTQNWIPSIVLGGFILILTFIVGRAWCGWVCPLGTLLDWTSVRYSHQRSLDIRPRWRQIKYFLLFTILLAALLGSLTLFVLDPITLLFRTITSVVLPGFSSIVTEVETWLYNIESLQQGVAWFDKVVRGSLLTEQPFFIPNLLLALLLSGVLALNVFRRRFWCSCLCPLGALLGLVSRFARTRQEVDQKKCIDCKDCLIICPTGAITAEQKFVASSTECTTCLDCVDRCPTKAIAFHSKLRSKTHQRFDPLRRQLLKSLGIATIGAALLNVIPSFSRTQSLFIRPPGTNENELMSKCIRCGECVRVCPTGVIQPSYSPADWEGMWTPTLETRLSYCDYSCTSCGEVCLTGAITRLSLEEKQITTIGMAYIDESRCIPFAEGRECIVCEEMCPVPEKAIRLKKETVVNSHGEISTVLQPSMIPDLCIGCGICEYKCPLDGEAAIRIFPTGMLAV